MTPPQVCGAPLHTLIFFMGGVVGVLFTLGLAAAISCCHKVVIGDPLGEGDCPGPGLNQERILLDEEDGRT